MEPAALRIRYPDLPIVERREEILGLLAANQVLVVAGETGSGKSTQLPKLCLELGRGDGALIGHTQPRRVAARAVAERVAAELGTDIGEVVAWSVRFDDRVRASTRVRVMTDGILLAELPRDPELRRYDTLIVDEAHERSLNVDFVLGYLRQLLPRRPDLKLVVTSATIDTARFSAHFWDAPVVEVSGRNHPVEVRYRPVVEDEGDRGRDQVQAICDAVEEAVREGPGDVLVFLSGEREIRDTADAIEVMRLRETEVLPLYARLTPAEQQRVFQPHRGRRVVLATNVAETSLTVPGVRYVVDPGTARISRFNRRTKVQRLPIEPISRASADQRAGRCGRLGPGLCIRLYSEEDYQGRPPFTDPEILRTNLASVVLQMASLGLGDVEAFPFVEPPDRRAVRDAVALLEELGAIEPGGDPALPALTPLGRRLARVPLDPRLARMVLAAEPLGCVHDVVVVAAALSIQDPRERPAEARAEADALHARFADPTSDFLSILNLWDHLRAARKELSSSQFRRRCRQEHLSHLRVREWEDLVTEVAGVLRSMKVRARPGGARDPDGVHQALLAGLLSHVGLRDDERRDYLGARGARFALSRRSGVAGRPPRWLMAGELVETNRLWAHTAARIRPEWAERAGAHLLEHHYGEPWWDARRGAAMVHRRSTLYGLPVVEARPIGVAGVDPAFARDMFVRHALVAGDWLGAPAALRRNGEVIAQVRDLAARARRRDLPSDEALYAFYDERVPAEVVSGGHFDRWWKQVRGDDPTRLDLTVEALLDGALVDPGAHPDEWRQDELALRLAYVHEPLAEDDGVTATVPLPLLHRLRPDGFDWHVPGYRREILATLLRGLPKAARRQLHPVDEHVEELLASVDPSAGPMASVLAAELRRRTGVAVTPADVDPVRLPPHLRMRFAVEEEGRTVGAGRDLAELQRRFEPRLRAAVAQVGRTLAGGPLRSWSIDALPKVVAARWGGHPIVARPALVDRGDHVVVEAFAGQAEQEDAMWLGTRRLLLLTVPFPRKALRERLTNRTKLALADSPHGDFAALLDDCVTAAVDLLLRSHGGPAWDADSFAELRSAVAAELPDRAVGVVAAVGRVLEQASSVRRRLAALASPSLRGSVADVEVQLSRLLFPGFVTATGAARLPDLHRYLRAAERRLERLPEAPERDLAVARRVRALEDALVGVRRADDVERLRWLLEELRVSLWAQQLGTAEKVSEERLHREIARLSA